MHFCFVLYRREKASPQRGPNLSSPHNHARNLTTAHSRTNLLLSPALQLSPLAASRSINHRRLQRGCRTVATSETTSRLADLALAGHNITRRWFHYGCRPSCSIGGDAVSPRSHRITCDLWQHNPPVLEVHSI